MTLTRFALLAAAAAILLIGARPIAGAVEQYPRGLMSVAPTVSDNFACTIEVRPVSFGTYDTLATAPLDAIGQVIYVCGNLGASSLAPVNKAIRIELTTGAANTFSPRSMLGPDPQAHLEYNLYLDSTHRTIWGQGAYGTDVYIDDHPPNKTPVTVPIFGRIPGYQDVPAGQYIDGVTARIVF